MSIGGYFELEVTENAEYHSNAFRLNTGRNAFEYILRAKKIKKVYLPYYTCDVLLEPLKRLKIEYDFYSINLDFSPIFDFESLRKGEYFLYTNYFGICDRIIEEISEKCSNLIIDNAQAFYSLPLHNLDTFYSPRKFFGLPDGAYLYTDKKLNEKLEDDLSFNRFEHLIGRIDLGAEAFYEKYNENRKLLRNQNIKKMSRLTHKLLTTINYDGIAKKRRANYKFLDLHLKSINKLSVLLNENSVPMIYPLFLENGKDIKASLIEEKIYPATYWPNVREWVDKNSVEYDLVENLIALPIDQRYGKTEMKIILKAINKLI